jgi:lipid kinase YegS
VRAAVRQVREEGQRVEVRCTCEGGDAERFAEEAVGDGVDVLVAGGGDGTLHEVVNGLMKAEPGAGTALGVLPLGTANDFARGCSIPLAPYDALSLAARGSPVPVDVAEANGVFFVNVASGGFGAQVTAGTPIELKNAAGPGAYALVGLLTAAKMTPYEGRFVSPSESAQGSFIALAAGNARQAGGGFQVTPKAYLNDGLLDLMVIADFHVRELGLVLDELQRFDDPRNRFVHYRQSPGFEIEVPGTLPINLDGEPHRWRRIAFGIRPGALRIVLPEGCPLLSRAL